MTYKSTKTFGHDVGLSCVFRQHRATHSHCSKLHGYAIAVKLVFGCSELDDRQWVMDFGGLKDIKKFLTNTFDHKTIVAEDDPMLTAFRMFHDQGIADLVTMPNVGCEAFAKYIFDFVEAFIRHSIQTERVWIESVEVMEHGANSAIYVREPKELAQVKDIMSELSAKLNEIKTVGEEFKADIQSLMKAVQ